MSGAIAATREGGESIGRIRPHVAAMHDLVALVGPPNSGKSTLFNRLTGLRQKVANYPGVTVERRSGTVNLESGRDVTLLDLPGVYSLRPRSIDERITHDVLHGEIEELARPGGIIIIIDSTNLERQLASVAPVLALGLPTLVALNMADELADREGSIDVDRLARRLGVPVALISAVHGEGVDRVYAFLEGTLGWGTDRQQEAIQLPVLQDVPARRRWASDVGEQAGYRAPDPPEWTRRLDTVLLHPVAGPLIFLAVVAVVFQSIFTLAQPLMDGVEALIGASGAWIAGVLPDGWVRSLVVDGIWNGVGSVVVFLPQILILFFFIGLLEDSGYIARAAVIADRSMHRVGLQGKSFLPLMSAYACAVPAVLAARTIESQRDRIATILIAPFMTCSARLPIYMLLIAAFVPAQPVLGPFLGTRALTMIGLYALGLLAAVATAALLRSSVLKPTPTPFVLEMPPYRRPRVRQILLRLVDRCKIFLRRAGTIILGVTLVLWFFTQVPRDNGNPPALEDSAAGRLGKLIEPAIVPLGFDWKIGVGLISSLAAREVIVSTLGTIYGLQEKTDETSLELQDRLRQDLTLGSAVALMIFFVFALQCASTVAVVRRETGGWKWPILQFGYMLLLAWVGSFAAYRLIG